ncbi:type II toxin-antitoxin system HigB family toxin [Pararhizobium sp.]|uniref:type II toxin-antitoxin system HigB family toxin n=1 Tax=Pararhizobium sp. TaxID=1977563 RepID=UPI0027283CF0|nr:type II toxin-antitoxin system HigB family toxin [Pararhizobium sp.]MDO9415854.1 type II toxin-antitoxin system HigB family toxin [Pararhizobium sp.]
MRVIAKPTLDKFGAVHSLAKPSLDHSYEMAKAASWSSIQDVTDAFSKAKALNDEPVRFEIKGGSYMLIVAFDFPRQIAFIKFVGTHAEYDKIDALTVSNF